MLSDAIDLLLVAWPNFCFGYPFVMAWAWMAGGLLFYFNRERRAVERKQIASVKTWPPISILVPCYNEAANAEETLSAAVSVDYPDFEVVAINDGSRDDTADDSRSSRGAVAEVAGRPSRAKSRQGRGAQHRRPACEARAARLHRRRRAARSAGAALGGAHVPATAPSAASPAIRASAIAARCWGACRWGSSRRSSGSSGDPRPWSAGSLPCPAFSARFASAPWNRPDGGRPTRSPRTST